jgi:hypothetical protein
LALFDEDCTALGPRILDDTIEFIARSGIGAQSVDQGRHIQHILSVQSRDCLEWRVKYKDFPTTVENNCGYGTLTVNIEYGFERNLFHTAFSGKLLLRDWLFIDIFERILHAGDCSRTMQIQYTKHVDDMHPPNSRTGVINAQFLVSVFLF